MDLQVIQNKIFEVKGYRVMIDFHLAELYGVPTKVLKQAVKRNIQRFPPDFRFTLTKEEWDELVTNCGQFPETIKHSYILPDCFTEQGIAMLSSVLHSQTAIDVNISIMRAFVLMRQMATGYEELMRRIEQLETTTNLQYNELYKALTELLNQDEDWKNRQPIGFITAHRGKQ